jgi:phospholipid/cholesterol/gamma-HCH transport system substrate-binding protein
MQSTNFFETLLSAIVIVVAVGFLGFTLWQTSSGSLSSYELNAQIKSADGLKQGADVKIAGVKVGSVEALNLDTRAYAVDLKLAIRTDIRIPEDSQLSIGGGALSSSSLSITPGRSTTLLPDGGALKTR